MIRGTLAIILEGCIYQSLEFNGNMYYEEGQDDYGHDAVKALERVNDLDSFKKAVLKFNKDHHHYDLRKESAIYGPIELNTLDFNLDYFKNWFSDYIYLKNCSNKEINIIERNEYKESKDINIITLKPDEIEVLHFGKFVCKIKKEVA